MCVRVVALSLLLGWLNLRKHRQIRKTRILLLISSFSSDISHKVFLMLSHMRRNSNKTPIFLLEKSGMYDRIFFYFISYKKKIFLSIDDDDDRILLDLKMDCFKNIDHCRLCVLMIRDDENYLFCEFVVELKMTCTNMWRCQIYA